jgi:hypothetical protein
VSHGVGPKLFVGMNFDVRVWAVRCGMSIVTPGILPGRSTCARLRLWRNTFWRVEVVKWCARDARGKHVAVSVYRSMAAMRGPKPRWGGNARFGGRIYGVKTSRSYAGGT